MVARADARLADLARWLGDRRAAPDLSWVTRLAGATVAEARRAMGGLLDHRDELEEIRATHREGGREMYAQIRAPFELYTIVRLLRPRHIVEAGVSSGVSSSHFLLAVADNGFGTLHSVDLPTRQRGPELGARESPVSLPPDRSTGWAVPDRLRAGWDLRIGPSQALLPPLVGELPEVGLFLHDDLHTPAHLAFELATVRPKLRPGAVVLADNTQWTGRAFDRFAAAIGAKIVPRGRTDLLGLRVPPEGPPGPARASAPGPRAAGGPSSRAGSVARRTSARARRR